jgi:hypothetical protein
MGRSEKHDAVAKPIHSYMLCGWRTRSEIPLTSMPTLVNKTENFDVVIEVAKERSPLAKSTDRFVFQHSLERSLIKIRGVADFEINKGRQIWVWPEPGAAQKDIEIFLFGQAWATLCHQRAVLPLHASAIVTGSGITAFAGHPGAGKSTTAALLNAAGYELITDDILPISFDDDSIPGARPYLPRLKLHLDPITKLGLTPTEAVSENLDKEKYFVRPIRSGDDKWRRVERLFLLERNLIDSGPPIEQLAGVDAVRALVDQTYQFAFVTGTRQFGSHLEFCTRLASNILIYRMRQLAFNDIKNVLVPLFNEEA